MADALANVECTSAEELFEAIKPKRSVQGKFEGLVPFFADRANFDERFLSSYLTLLAQGQISPTALPPQKAK